VLKINVEANPAMNAVIAYAYHQRGSTKHWERGDAFRTHRPEHIILTQFT